MPRARRPEPELSREGWQGWDAYADFYDWENTQTLDRRDVRFWQQMAQRAAGPVLELGAGTGRVTIPVARVLRQAQGASSEQGKSRGGRAYVVAVDRSAEMLAYARRRARRARVSGCISWLRGDIRALPLRSLRGFALVMAPYGVVQSLIRESDLEATLTSVAAVLAPGGLFGLDLVPDLPVWKEYRNQVRLEGQRRGGRSRITLIESVRQDRTRRLTLFDQKYIEQGEGKRTTRHFSLVFRTLTVEQVTRRLEKAGFRIRAVLGDYSGKPWDPRADVWLILAEKTGGSA